MKQLFWYGGALSTLLFGYLGLRSSGIMSSSLQVDSQSDSGSNSGSDSQSDSAINRPFAQISIAATLPVADTRETQDRSWLNQAHARARADHFQEALTILSQIPADSAYFPLTQQFRETWSRELLQRAVDQYLQTRLSMALQMLAAIPSDTSSYPQAMELHALWKKEATLAPVVAQAEQPTSPTALTIAPPLLISRFSPSSAPPPARPPEPTPPTPIDPIAAASTVSTTNVSSTDYSIQQGRKALLAVGKTDGWPPRFLGADSSTQAQNQAQAQAQAQAQSNVLANRATDRATELDAKRSSAPFPQSISPPPPPLSPPTNFPPALSTSSVIPVPDQAASAPISDAALAP